MPLSVKKLQNMTGFFCISNRSYATGESLTSEFKWRQDMAKENSLQLSQYVATLLKEEQ